MASSLASTVLLLLIDALASGAGQWYRCLLLFEHSAYNVGVFLDFLGGQYTHGSGVDRFDMMIDEVEAHWRRDASRCQWLDADHRHIGLTNDLGSPFHLDGAEEAYGIERGEIYGSVISCLVRYRDRFWAMRAESWQHTQLADTIKYLAKPGDLTRCRARSVIPTDEPQVSLNIRRMHRRDLHALLGSPFYIFEYFGFG